MGILSSLLGIGQSAPTPVAPQSITTTELAKEVAPFMKDLLAKGQALYKQRTEEGYQPYTGPTIAQLTPEQLQAREGLTGLVGTQAPQFAKAQELTEGVAEQMTPTALEQYMSPYQQAVTDIEKAEAQKTFERDVLPKVRQAQIGAGAFGGTRGTMLEAQALADQQRLVGDIQTRGSQAAYQDAVRAFEAQKAREGQTAGALAQLAPAAFRAQTGEQALLETIGKEDQMRSQTALDEAYKQYLEERVYPERTLGQYQSVIAGFPSASVTRSVTTAPQPQQSGLGSLLGGALNLGNIYGTFGGFTKGGFGSAYTPYGRAEGGPVVERQYGGEVGTGGLVGLTDDGTQIFDHTQTGILNRALHGGILQGQTIGSGSTDDKLQPMPDTGTTSGTSSSTFTGSTLPNQLNIATHPEFSSVLEMPSVQDRGGHYNASEFRDAGMSLSRPDNIPETILQERSPQTGTPYADPATGTIPYDLWINQPVQTYGQGHDLGDMDYFTANQLALNEGADRFMYGGKYAAVDPGLLSNYQDIQDEGFEGGIKPWRYSMHEDKTRAATHGENVHQYGGYMLPPDPNSPQAMKAKGYIMSSTGQWVPSGTTPRDKLIEARNQGIDISNPWMREQLGYKHGGLVDLPVVQRRTGRKVDGEKKSIFDEGMPLNFLKGLGLSKEEKEILKQNKNIEPNVKEKEETIQTEPSPIITTEPPVVNTIPEIDLSTISGKELETLGGDVKGKAIRSQLYNAILTADRNRQERKVQTDADIAAAAEAEERQREFLKSRAIGDMMGALARGMKAGAGQGFGGELLSGLEEAAGKASEIAPEDVKAIEAKDKELRKIKKDAAIEWDKGNIETALALHEVYDKELANTIALKEANIQGIVNEEQLTSAIAEYFATGQNEMALSLAKKAYNAGALSADVILGITNSMGLAIPEFLGGSGSDQLTGGTGK